MIEPRPKSLAEVAQRSHDSVAFEYELADFLHEFQRRQDPEMLREKPELLFDRYPNGALHDAYLAAVSAYFSMKLKSGTPRWTRDPERVLVEPWFAMPGRHMRATLLVESPAAFRERNLFVTANALTVA